MKNIIYLFICLFRTFMYCTFKPLHGFSRWLTQFCLFINVPKGLAIQVFKEFGIQCCGGKKQNELQGPLHKQFN